MLVVGKASELALNCSTVGAAAVSVDVLDLDPDRALAETGEPTWSRVRDSASERGRAELVGEAWS